MIMTFRFSKFILLLVTILYYSVPCQAQENNDAALKAVLALNYSQLSLSRIISYNNIIVLHQEYNNILSNIDLSNINDEEIVDLIATAMDTISSQKMNEGDLNWLQKDYQRKIDKAVSSSFAQIGSGLYGASDPYSASMILLAKIGSTYFQIQNIRSNAKYDLDKEKWEIEKDTLDALNEHRKDMFRTSWDLIKRYKYPDIWRIAEEQVNSLIETMKDKDPARRQRKLKRLEKYFEKFPPFWYYYGKTAHELENVEVALQRYNQFEEIRKGIFRHDILYASMCMNRISLLDAKKEGPEIIRNLNIIEEQIYQDATVNFFLAINYIKLKNYKKAKEFLIANIDDNNNVALSSRLLGDLMIKTESNKELDKLLEEMIQNDNIKNTDYLYLVGRARDITTLNKFKEQIKGVGLVIESNWGARDSILVKLNKKWFYDDIKLKLKLLGKTYEPDLNDIRGDENNNICVNFPEVIEQDDYIEIGRDYSFILTIDNPLAIIDFRFESYIIDEKIQFRLEDFQFLGEKYALIENDIKKVATIKTGINNILLSIINEFPMSYLNTMPNIGKKKYENAREKYKIPKDENIYALYDSTVFGSAKEGIAFCKKGVYYRNSGGNGQRVGKISYNELKTSNIEKVKYGIMINDKHYFPIFLDYDIEQMIKLLNKIKNTHTQYHQAR